MGLWAAVDPKIHIQKIIGVERAFLGGTEGFECLCGTECRGGTGVREGVGLRVRPKCGRETEGLSAGVGWI
jgi:hypothetical protein